MDKRIIGRFSRGAAMAAVLSTAGCKSQSLSYTNPVWDANLADPAVLGWNGEWYAYGTGSEEGTNRQFPMLHSTDFVHWEPVGYAMEALEKPQFKEYWAPEVVERDGVFYLFYAGNRRMRVAQAESPLGPFTDCGVYLFPEWEFSIDGHPFCDPDTGEWYLFFARDFLDVERVGTGLSVVRLGDDMISVQGPVQTVLTAFADWQIYKRNRRMYDGVYDWHTVEGPWVVKRNGLYYCFYSASNWQTPHYGVGFAVAEHPMGPWMDGGNTEYATVLNGMDNGLIGPGHNSVAIGLDGETHFMVYHSWNPERTARVMCIDPIEWTSDGPRVVNPAFGNKVFAR